MRWLTIPYCSLSPLASNMWRPSSPVLLTMSTFSSQSNPLLALATLSASNMDYNSQTRCSDKELRSDKIKQGQRTPREGHCQPLRHHRRTARILAEATQAQQDPRQLPRPDLLTSNGLSAKYHSVLCHRGLCLAAGPREHLHHSLLGQRLRGQEVNVNPRYPPVASLFFLSGGLRWTCTNGIILGGGVDWLSSFLRQAV